QIFYSSIGIFAFVWFLDSVKHFHFLPNSLISCCYKGQLDSNAFSSFWRWFPQARWSKYW
ncbi:unnamed protein product, partial [Musa textilis]